MIVPHLLGTLFLYFPLRDWFCRSCHFPSSSFSRIDNYPKALITDLRERDLLERNHDENNN